MKNQKEVCRAVAVVEAKPVDPEVLPPLGEIEEPSDTKPAERINFHLSMGQHHGRLALAHLILAGWELSKQKETLGHGGWRTWCQENLSISFKTADRYIMFFSKTVGKVRAERQIPFAKRVTNKELAAATVGMEEKSTRQAMIDLNIIKRADWGGSRVEQAAKNGHRVGRKPDEEPTAEEEVIALDEIANTPAAMYTLCRDPLHKLNDLQREQNFIDRLEFVELSEVYSILKGLFEAADKAMKRMQKEGRHA